MRDSRRLLVSLLLISLMAAAGVSVSGAQEPPPAKKPPAGVEKPGAEKPATPEPVPEAPAKTPEEKPAATAGQDAKASPPAGANRLLRYRPASNFWFALDVAGFEAMKKAYLGTAIRKLLADESVAPLLERIVQRFEKKMAAIKAMSDLAREAGVEEDLEDHMYQELKKLQDVRPTAIRLYVTPIKRVRDGKASEDYDGAAVFCGVALREADVDLVRKSLDENMAYYLEKGQQKKTGVVKAFGDREVTIYGPGPKNKTPKGFIQDSWQFLDGRELYFGWNTADQLERLTDQPDVVLEQARAKVAAGGTAIATFVFDVATAVREASKNQDAAKKQRSAAVLEALGFSDLKSVAMGIAADGACWRETLFLEIPGEPRGLLAAMVAPANGQAAIPALPTPDQPFMTLKGRFDAPAFLAAVKRVEEVAEETDREKKAAADEPAGEGSDDKLPDTLFGVKLQDVAKILGGGWSLSMAAPPAPTAPPRMSMAVALADTKAFDDLVGRLKEKLEGVTFQDRKFKDSTITSIHIANAPIPMLPSFARRDQVLYVAESPRTLKLVLDALKGKEPARADVAYKLPPIFPEGGRAPVLEVSYDTAEIYRMMNDLYLPLLQMVMERAMRDQSGNTEPLLDFAELPPTSVVSRHLGPGLGGVAWGPGGLTMTAVSPLGDPITAVSLSIYPTFMLWGIGQALDGQVAAKEKDVCHRRLRKIREALKLYSTSFGGGQRNPTNLGALFGRALVEDESVFKVPSDKNPARVEYENEDGEVESIEVSYKYMPDSKLKVPARDLQGWNFRGSEFNFDLGGRPRFSTYKLDEGDGSTREEKTVLLYELNENRHQGRFLLCTDGSIYHLPEKKFQEVLALK